jgi:hypothetical protein
MTKRDLSYKQDKEWIANFRIRPLLNIINKRAYDTGIWWTYLTYFWNKDEWCMWFKQMKYWIRNLSICIMPPYYYSEKLWYNELVQIAMNADAENTRYIIEN